MRITCQRATKCVDDGGWMQQTTVARVDLCNNPAQSAHVPQNLKYNKKKERKKIQVIFPSKFQTYKPVFKIVNGHLKELINHAETFNSQFSSPVKT